MEETDVEDNGTTTGSRSHRREMRWPCTPTVVYAHLDGYDEPVPAQIVEISKAGVQLHISEPLAVGSLMTLEMGGTTVLGDVRHCDIRADQSYTVGVQLCDVKG
jgi:hypothetical protein